MYSLNFIQLIISFLIFLRGFSVRQMLETGFFQEVKNIIVICLILWVNVETKRALE